MALIFLNNNPNLEIAGIKTHTWTKRPYINLSEREYLNIFGNINDGSPTRHDINADRLSALDFTFASPNLGIVGHPEPERKFCWHFLVHFGIYANSVP